MFKASVGYMVSLKPVCRKMSYAYPNFSNTTFKLNHYTIWLFYSVIKFSFCHIIDMRIKYPNITNSTLLFLCKQNLIWILQCTDIKCSWMKHKNVHTFYTARDLNIIEIVQGYWLISNCDRLGIKRQYICLLCIVQNTILLIFKLKTKYKWLQKWLYWTSNNLTMSLNVHIEGHWFLTYPY